MSTSDAKQAAAAYCQRGWSPIPVPYRTKKPVLKGWQKLRITAETVDSHWNGARSNLGVLLGAPSKNLVDIDLDCPEALVLADVFLPTTHTVFGRPGAPRSHRLYICDPLSETTKLQDPTKSEDDKKAMIVEFRSTGAQTVFPPSVHESGESIAWAESGEPTTLTGTELLYAVQQLATAALLARHWPSTGSRHDAALALTGGLLRAGWPMEQTADFVQAVAEAAGDEETRDRVTTVETTARRLAQDKTAKGWPTLAQLMPQVVVDRVIEWLGIETSRDDGARLNIHAEPDEDVTQPADIVCAFPVEVFPGILQQLIAAAAAALPCPPEFIGVPMLTAMGVAIGASRVIEVKRGWQEGPRLYTAIVGDPGSRKSAAIDLVISPFRDRQQRLAEQYEQRRKTYETAQAKYEIDHPAWREQAKLARRGDAEIQKPEPQAPVSPVLARVYTSDATIEAICGLIHTNPRGLVFFKDELVGWCRAMDQYKAGKGADRQAWLSFWSGSPFVIDRKSNAAVIILNNPFIGVLGSMPPEMLGELSDERGREDGFIHRILFGYPDPVALKWTDEDIPPELTRGYGDLMERLWSLQSGLDEPGICTPRVVRFTPAGRAAFVEWIEEHFAKSGNVTESLRGPWAKMQGQLVRIALILQEARYVAGEAESEDVDEYSVWSAASLTFYFKSHARRVYDRLHAGKEEKAVLRARDWIKRHGGQVTLREIYHRHIAGIRTQKDAKTLLAALVEYGYGTTAKGDHGSMIFTLKEGARGPDIC